MSEYIEVRWHARAGQGAVTAAKALAEAATTGGKFVQAFPEYGPERMGAPLRAYNRISDKPISIYCQVTNPNIVVVIDQTLLAGVDVTEGVAEDGVYIINTERTVDEIRKSLNLKNEKAKVYVVDATKISLETIGRPIPNTPILGAIAKVTNFVKIENIKNEIETTFGKKFGKKVVEANHLAIERAYKEVKGE
ncbi:MAG: pyruvate synthase [Candidatus Schekmanbacteria bacterium RBG_16_38_11]|uniref:Pyruvate synthase n=1 Tax=Candidatus Schekmanbacteria bacterium RBG_16_38_11 TaxID=1817880 RepID=A0A1F7S1L0_9BACT|nr:MAG: pyruvate synthase [Candidatus Schekmanbacteria bacterium RBG_16_38_11]